MPSRIPHVHYLLFVLVFAISYGIVITRLGWSEALLLSFLAALLSFVTALLPLVRTSTPDDMRIHAARNDAGRAMLSLVTAVIVAVVMTAITVELGEDGQSPGRLALAAAAMFSAWVFANLVATLHYAHLFYDQIDGADRGGIDFPGTPQPDYLDFCYFAFVIGMTFQVSDVTTSAPSIRRLVLAHALVAFLFNIGAVALTVNIVAGSLGGRL